MEECVWLMLNFFWRYVLSIPDRMRFTVVPLKDAVFGFHANSLLLAVLSIFLSMSYLSYLQSTRYFEMSGILEKSYFRCGPYPPMKRLAPWIAIKSKIHQDGV